MDRCMRYMIYISTPYIPRFHFKSSEKKTLELNVCAYVPVLVHVQFLLDAVWLSPRAVRSWAGSRAGSGGG